MLFRSALQADSLLSEPPGQPKNTGVGSLSLLQGISLTQELNRGLLHCITDIEHRMCLDFPGGSEGKESACNAGDAGLIPGLGRSPGEGNGYTHSSILAWRIPWTRGAWQATIHEVTNGQTRLRD